jgi:hypothetical protein
MDKYLHSEICQAKVSGTQTRQTWRRVWHKFCEGGRNRVVRVRVRTTWDFYTRMWNSENKVEKRHEEAMSLPATQPDPQQVALEQVESFQERGWE